MNKKEVVIIGFGAHAVSILSTIAHLDLSVIGYVDNKKSVNNPYSIKYLGNDEQYLKTKSKDRLHICGIGDNHKRSLIQKTYVAHGHQFTNIFHPTCCIESHVQFGVGIFIGAFAYVNDGTRISDGVIINNHVNVDHQCEISSFVHLGPGVVLTGGVQIDCHSFIGAGSTIIPDIRIGSNVIAGAGSVITKNIESDLTVLGVPAKPISNDK